MTNSAVETKGKFSVRDMTIIALMAAIICILAPLSIPIGPVPISLTNLALYFILYIVGTKKTTIAFVIYMLLGLVGLPVFSGFTGGPQKLFGPTGGYIIGFIFMVLIAGFFIDKFPKKWPVHFLGMVLGTLVLYAFGTAWFLVVMDGYTILTSLSVCVFPFIPGDIIKMVLAIVVGGQIADRVRLNK